MTAAEKIKTLGDAFNILASMSVRGENVDLMHEAKVRIAAVHKDLVEEQKALKDREEQDHG